MSISYTTNLGLAKPDGSELVGPDDFNTNSDIIDSAVGELQAIAPAIRRNFVNILRLKLQQALAASDIDAWSDLFDDDSLISSTTGAVVSEGQISAALSQTLDSHSTYFGYSTTNRKKIGQSFLAPLSGSLSSVSVKLKKSGSPTDNVVMEIYATSGGIPTGSALYTSTNTIAGTAITNTEVEYTFNFSDASLSESTTYAFVLERSGELSTSNYYHIYYKTASSYADGGMLFYASETWSSNDSCDLYFVISGLPGVVVWDAVTPTEALTYIAVTADQNEGTGSITWYVSDDGSSWTEITSLDALQSVSFSGTDVYLKCVLTGDATVDAVAYGGY